MLPELWRKLHFGILLIKMVYLRGDIAIGLAI